MPPTVSSEMLAKLEEPEWPFLVRFVQKDAR